MKKYRVWAEIDLDQVSENIRSIGSYVGPGVDVMVIVKADAYGHGAVPISKVAVESGANMLGVGDSNEAISLRQAGILEPILVLGALIEEEIGWVVSYDIIPTVHSLDIIPLLEHEARRQRRRVKVHLKVDTGMSRLGASPTRAPEIARRVADSDCLHIEGLSTHLSSVVESEAYTSRQLQCFRRVIESFRKQGIHVPCCHAANSAGTFSGSECHFDMVRPGIAVYGIDPGVVLPIGMELKPCMSLHSQICFLKGVRAGTPVGYGMSAVTDGDTKLATVPIGYCDGYPYRLSNIGKMLVRGVKVPVIGSVTMDYTILDVGEVPEVAVGDEVVVFGRQLENAVTVNEIAVQTGTIPYDITCSLGERVKRIYRSS